MGTSSPPPDAEILARARRGDASAFEVIVRHYQHRIYGLAWRLVYDEELARDIAQDVFLRLFERLDRYDPTRPFEPWFLTLATNLALNARARAQLRRAASLDAPASPGSEAARETVDPGAPRASEAAAESEERAAVRAAVRALPDLYAGVVALHYLEGLGVREIGERLGMPEGTVKIRLHRARALLKESLATRGPGPSP